MKRILLALTTVGLFLPVVPRAQADPEVSLDFFYDNLSNQGSWLEVADYGYVFQPNVAVDNSDWRPYSDGYWAYTDAGWTWVSYEDFGWATYHYGSWGDLDDYGWVWVPGYEWGPAWVSWRTGGDYVGWAPLPPQAAGIVYEGRAITGAVDVTFGIGPLYYNFCDIRYLGEPLLRGRLIAPSRNVTIINSTVNVTNITINNRTVINNGPDLNRVNRFSARPIQRLALQRETNVSDDFATRRGSLNRVNGNTLTVAAPAVQRSQEKFAPRQVKARVDKPRIDKGWRGINNRQQVEEAMKENPRNVPQPAFQPQKASRGQPGAEQATNANRNRSMANPTQPSDQPVQSNVRENGALQTEQRRTGTAPKDRQAGQRELQAEREKNEAAQPSGQGSRNFKQKGQDGRQHFEIQPVMSDYSSSVKARSQRSLPRQTGSAPSDATRYPEYHRGLKDGALNSHQKGEAQQMHPQKLQQPRQPQARVEQNRGKGKKKKPDAEPTP